MKKTPADCVVPGRNGVRELLRSAPGRIAEILTTSDPKELFRTLAIEKGGTATPIRKVPSSQLDTLCHGVGHQGVAAILHERTYQSLSEFFESLAGGPGLVLALDNVFDPHNFGAILRAAECFGVSAVVWSKNRGCSITPAVCKVSSGASELVPLIPISNLAQTLDVFRRNDFWIACAEDHERAQLLSDYECPDRLLLILGSEGEGISRLVREKADISLVVPMHGEIDSLNVSQAASVLLYGLTIDRRA